MAHRFTEHFGAGLRVVHCGLSGKEHVADAGGIFLRLVERGPVAILRRIEDHDVGPITGAKVAPLRNAEDIGRQSRGAADRLGQRQDLLFDCIAADLAGESAEVPRVVVLVRVERPRGAVGGCCDPGQSHRGLHVGLRHGMADDLRILLGHDLQDQVHGVDLLAGGDLLEALADIVRELLARADHDLFRSPELIGNHPPHQGGELRLGRHPLRQLGALAPLDLRLRKGGVHEREGIGGVGILVGGNPHALRAGLFDHRRGLADFAPVGNLHRLEVRDVDRHAGLAANSDRLGYRFEDAVALIANVAHVDSAVGSHHLCQSDDLIGLSIRPGCIDQPCRHPPGPLAHRLVDQRLHPLELFGRRSPPRGTEHSASDCAVPDEVQDVRAGAVTVDVLEELRHVAAAAAVAGTHGRAALQEIVHAGANSRLAQGSVGVGVEVDEPRRNDAAAAVNAAADLSRRELAHADDPPRADSHVAHHRFSA